MVYKAKPTMPVGALRTQQAEILAQLGETPILLTQRGHAAGVLVHPDLWNKLIDRLEDQSDLVAALEAELAVERGEEEIVEADITELETTAYTFGDSA